MRSSHITRHTAHPAKRGFALLITITLLAFLVILLIGLATYTRIETAIAGNTQRQAQARENALFALNIALGQLQKYAGPDKRVTATADAVSTAAGSRHYTGVWPTDPADDPDSDPLTPLTWLASGNEALNADGTPVDALAIKPGVSLTATNSAELVGTKTSGAAGDVRARLVDITSVGVPGVSATGPAPTIGRYAWWVGDQGVKAPVAVADNSNSVDYAPFDSADLRSRIRQQIALGAGAFNSSTHAAEFEPRDTSGGSSSNATLASRTLALSQIAFLKNSSSVQLGLTRVVQNFHAWSPNNLAVLANTKVGGLRQDLSLRPDLLGAGFTAWANYSAYMEDPANPRDPKPIDAYSGDPLRRRYFMTPPTSSDGVQLSVAPVLSFFGLSFSFRNNDKSASPTNLEVSARCVIGLWNPYSSAIVPEDMQVIVTGLRDVNIATSVGGPPRHIDLQPLMGGDLKFSLPFTPNSTDSDHSSWLPGRVYNWSALSNTSDPGDPGNPMQFYLRDATPSGGSGVVRDAGPPLPPDSIGSVTTYRQCIVTQPQTLTIELRRASDGQTLATFTSPEFESFSTDAATNSTGDKASDFAYVFRLPDGPEIPLNEVATWLQADGRDPRESLFPQTRKSGFIVAGGQEPRPELLVTKGQAGFPASYSQLLLDRYTNDAGKNYNEDAPVFELPRAPLLSLGSLQHLMVVGSRPFAIGNSWGGSRNAWFDSYFFSGLVPTTAWDSVSKPLPNPMLQVVRRKVDGTAVDVGDLNGSDRVADGFSSKHLLQGAAFNVNSVNLSAWVSVLRSVRFLSTSEFTYNDVSATTGTEADSATTLSDPQLSNSRIAGFARFGQSAQETFKADDNYVQSDPASATNTADTPLFRRGVRLLSSSEVEALASAIKTLVEQKLSASGPFISMEEFLSPSALFVGASGNTVSLLEKAIEDAGTNANITQFSSQWLTQGDIMTALAPVLFPRSDTFVIRAYGEAVNPITTNTEGRAWCEAIVQRLPEYFNASADDATVSPPTDPLNVNYGRRFKVVSFRWLTRSDI